MNTNNICKNCRHWNKLQTCNDNRGICLNRCGKVTAQYDDSEKRIKNITIFTDNDFGCISFVKKI